MPLLTRSESVELGARKIKEDLEFKITQFQKDLEAARDQDPLVFALIVARVQARVGLVRDLLGDWFDFDYNDNDEGRDFGDV